MIKPGVDIRNLVPQMAVAYTIATLIYQKFGYVCTITAGFDGVHMPNTLHQRDGLCRALDLRTNTLNPHDIPLVHAMLKEALGPQFNVVLEKDHIHTEFDPK